MPPVLYVPTRSEAKQVLDVCANYFEVDPLDMKHDRRFTECVNARHCAWIILHDRGASLSRMGRLFDRDHTTISHGVSGARRKHFAWHLQNIQKLLPGSQKVVAEVGETKDAMEGRR